MSGPLTTLTAPAVTRLRAALAGRIAASALATSSPRAPASRQPIDTEAAVALLRRASAGWLRDNAAAWRPLLAAPAATTAGTAAADGTVARTRSLDIVRAVIAEVGAVLQAGSGSDAARNAIARAIARVAVELERWQAPRREPAGEARSAPAESAPTWSPFSPYTAPGPRRVRRRAARRGGDAGTEPDADDRSRPDDASSPADRHTAAQADAGEALLDIVRWLERHDGRADYGWLAGRDGRAPTGRVVDDSA